MIRASALLVVVVVLSLLVCVSANADPIPLPGVEVVSLGCAQCRAGDRLHVVLRVWRPGVAIDTAEVRATVRTPQGQTVKLPLSETLVSLPAGLSSVMLLDATVGNEAPGVYLFEGAILDPVSGVTLSRHVLGVVRE